MATQSKIAQTILERGADYLLALKDSQRSLAEEVALFFDSTRLNLAARKQPVHETTDADHGRTLTRRHRVSRDVASPPVTRRTPGEQRFPGLRAIAMLKASVERDGKTTTARRFFLSSLALDPQLLARAVRAHWGFEPRLHWCWMWSFTMT